MLALGAAGATHGQEFKPYPRANVTKVEWQTYLDEVRAKHGANANTVDAQQLIIFQDPATGTSYAFTTQGHPAHPAWITRRVETKGGDVGINQIGYFVGSEAPFAEMYKAFLKLNDELREHMKRNAQSPGNK